MHFLHSEKWDSEWFYLGLLSYDAHVHHYLQGKRYCRWKRTLWSCKHTGITVLIYLYIFTLKQMLISDELALVLNWDLNFDPCRHLDA